MTVLRTSRNKLARARELRQASTAAEQLVWEILRNRRILGLKFRRQKVIYEVDGPIHEDENHARSDVERTQALEHAGIQVLRIKNEDVTLEVIEALISQTISPSGPPSPASGEGDRG